MIDKTPLAPDTADFEAATAAPDTARYVLRLYVTGTTPHSTRAIINIRKISCGKMSIPI